jgi:uncharacterized membrane protein
LLNGIAYILSLVAATRLNLTSSGCNLLLIVLGLNPFLTGYLHSGYHDVLVLLWLTLALLTLQRGHVTLSAVLLACAATIKHYVILILPFYLLFVAQPNGVALSWRELKPHWPRVTRPALAFALTASAILLPFVLWDAQALYRSLFTYMDTYYPIKGYKSYGIGSIFLYFGVVDGPRAPFPFWAIRLVVAVPLMGALLVCQSRANTLKRMLESYFIVSLFFLVFGVRAAHENYIGYLISVLALTLTL